MKKDTLQEQLEKFKLYSNYSSSQTLDENIENIFEQNTYNTAFGQNPMYSVKPTTKQVTPPAQPTAEKTYTVAEILKDLQSGALGPTNTGAGTTLKDIQKGIDKIKDGIQFNQVSAEMAKKPILGYNSIIKLLRGEINGADVAAIQNIKNSLNKKGINLVYKSKGGGSGEVDPNSIYIEPASIANNPVTPKVDDTQPPANNQPPAKQAVSFKPNDNFPLKFMDMGEKVKQLQKALNVMNKAGQPNITGKFYTTTEQKLVNKMDELGLTYDRKIGVDEKTFNLIMNQNTSNNNQKTSVEPVGVDNKQVNLNPQNELPKNVSAPSVTNQIGTNPQQYYEQLVSMNYIDPVGGNRIVYRGPKADKTVIDNINDYLQSQGYTQTRERNPQNRNKQIVVWKK